MIKYCLSLVALLMTSSFLLAQINWEVNKDDVTLNPTSYICKGSLAIRLGSKNDNTTTPASGELTIDFDEKVIYLYDGEDIFRFKADMIDNLKVEGYKSFSGEQVFKREFTDSLLDFYRKGVYHSLSLNQIQFSSSKRVEYASQDNDLVLKNQKISKGKICFVSPTDITILTEEGELNDFKDGDFNFLQVGSFKAFKCRALYDFIFESFKSKLYDNIMKWETEMKNSTLDSIIAIYGPMDNITNISPDRKMITWRKHRPVYYVNLNTYNSRISNTFHNSSTNIVSSQMSSIYGISPFFLFGNSYRTTNVNYSGNATTVASSQTSQTGRINMEDEGLSLTLMLDANNKIISVYQEKIFTDLAYGQPFRFISF